MMLKIISLKCIYPKCLFCTSFLLNNVLFFLNIYLINQHKIDENYTQYLLYVSVGWISDVGIRVMFYLLDALQKNSFPEHKRGSHAPDMMS